MCIIQTLVSITKLLKNNAVDKLNCDDVYNLTLYSYLVEGKLR